MKILLCHLLAAVLVLGLAACGSTGATRSDEEAIQAVLDRLDMERGRSLDNVANFRMTGWQSINNRNLILTAGLRNRYLINLMTPCLDLPYAFSIGLETRTSALSRGDYIVVNSRQQPRERCMVQEITRLVDRE